MLNVVYMSYGLAGLPIQLIKGTIDLEPASDHFQGDLQHVRDQLRIIQDKYHQKKRHHISLMDKENYKMFKRQEKLLSLQQSGQRNVNYEESKLWRQISAFLKFVNMHRMEIGQGCLALSCIIACSMFITNLDRLLHSECGFKCGYFLESPQIFNPLDYLLRRLSSKHNYIINMEMFLDILLFVLITLYCVICIFWSIVKIGINFFTYEIYKVKRRETIPQALSITSVLVIFMMFAFSLQVMTMAPLYTMFGD